MSVMLLRELHFIVSHVSVLIFLQESIFPYGFAVLPSLFELYLSQSSWLVLEYLN